jgi:hypothetical protein
LLQQSDGSRISGFLKNGKLMETMYDDVHTLYEAIKRGARVSSKYKSVSWAQGENGGQQIYPAVDSSFQGSRQSLLETLNNDSNFSPRTFLLVLDSPYQSITEACFCLF